MNSAKFRLLSLVLAISSTGTTCSAVTANVISSPDLPSNSTADSSSKVDSQKQLKGEVVETINSPAELIDHLISVATTQDNQHVALSNREHKYHGNLRGAVTRVSDMAEFMTAYKGFQASSEAADVILEEKLKLKSRNAVEFLRQRQHDQLHVQVVSSLMELASGLGLQSSSSRDAATQQALTELTKLVGETEAKHAVESMKLWAANLQQTTALARSTESWDVARQNASTESLVELSLKNDPVVAETRDKLHKYNHRSKLMMATAKVVNTSLSVAMFSPTWVSPAAQVALLVFLTATGGPEEAKLLKELYLDRRIESRCRMINKEASMAVNNYNISMLTGNSVLNEFCKATIGQMAGAEAIDTVVLGTDNSRPLEVEEVSAPSPRPAGEHEAKPNQTADSEKEISL